jgi:hypothetical protein
MKVTVGLAVKGVNFFKDPGQWGGASRILWYKQMIAVSAMKAIYRTGLKWLNDKMQPIHKITVSIG